MQGKRNRPEVPPQAVLDLYADFNDHAQFCRESFTIRNKDGIAVPMELQPAQLRLEQLLDRAIARRRPIRLIALKARQVMVSAAVAARFTKNCAFRGGQRAMIVAHQEDASKNIFGYYHQLATGYEKFRGVIDFPEIVRDAEDKGLLEFGNKSRIEVATANNVKIGRSASIRFLHLSEYAFWRDAKTTMTGLMAAVPKDPDSIVIIESTANGMGGDFYRQWMDANDPQSGSEWLPMFFAWWEHPEYRMFVGEPERFQDSLTCDELELQARYGLALNQLAWRRYMIRTDMQGSEDRFRQEYPACPEEAFLNSGRPRFHLPSLNRMPIEDQPTTGNLEIVKAGPRETIQFRQHDHGYLTIFRRPQRNKRYTCGVDVAEGIDVGEGVIGSIDPDYTVADFYDIDTGEQVAMLRGRLDPAAAADHLCLACQWYNNAYAVIEANGPGLALIVALCDRGFPPEQFYRRRPAPDEQWSGDQGAVREKIGWKTSATTRQQLISALDGAIRDGSIIFHSALTVAEHQSFVYTPAGRAEAREGCHDDTVIGAGLGLVGILNPPPDPRLNQARKLLSSESTPARRPVAVRTYGSWR